MTKSYYVSTGLTVVGITAILLPSTPTFAEPLGEVQTAVGILMLGLAAATASIRHALAKLERKFDQHVQNILGQLRKDIAA